MIIKNEKHVTAVAKSCTCTGKPGNEQQKGLVQKSVNCSVSISQNYGHIC